MEAIVVGVITWVLKTLGSSGLILLRKYLNNKMVDDKIGGESGAISKALKEIGEVDRTRLVDGRLSKDQEDKLREATRRLKSGLLG